LDAVVRGRVQGVGFRMFVRDRAIALDLRGWVANQADGTVRVVAEGSRERVDRLLAVLHDGPRGGRVESVDESWMAAGGIEPGFGIRSGWHGGD
ncbi:MAG TPA: acylphosphatase, partial [Candidatus Limnocylindrales bacterium]|nr:acylphosphatase [Candidatus Limnocylindrales bacterium]